ncbi:MAG: hypothetical protein JWQ77_2841 [Jatrophihabitans sp.]|nr:hypothetical protein [Jatrophihabitans sp.]
MPSRRMSAGVHRMVHSVVHLGMHLMVNLGVNMAAHMVVDPCADVRQRLARTRLAVRASTKSLLDPDPNAWVGVDGRRESPGAPAPRP